MCIYRVFLPERRPTLQTIPNPDSRLLSALPFLKRGGRCIDVGTDHAYLPIYLIQNQIVRHAMACDINEGPLKSAKEHIALAGMEKQIDTFLTDGLHGLEFFDADDILIFGMGGELIVKILTEAPWVKNKKIGLILQPMSRASVLRAYLTENGFEICDEALSESGKIYQTIYARYSGQISQYNEEELLLGKRNIESPTPLFTRFVEHELSVWQRVLQGKEKSQGADTSEELQKIQLLTKRLESLQ